MWGLETIREINKEAQHKAAGKPPLKVDESMDSEEALKAPHLGYDCENWDATYERVSTLFCDSTGFGASNEPALTKDQLIFEIDDLRRKHGTIFVAIEEVGQFQLYLAVWADQAPKKETG
jgi:phosphoribosylaminoimidazole (AIR) synthetase